MTFSRDDGLIEQLIAASRFAADEILGDIIKVRGEVSLQDFNSFADTAAMLAVITAVGSPTLTLEPNGSDRNGMKMIYSPGNGGFLFALNVLDLSQVHTIRLMLKGDLEDNSEEAIKIKLRSAAKGEIIDESTKPVSITRSDDFVTFDFNIRKFKTTQGIKDIDQISIEIDPINNGSGELIFDDISYMVFDEVPPVVKIGALRWIANKYRNRVSGLASEKKGPITFSYGDPIPDEWQTFREINV